MDTHSPQPEVQTTQTRRAALGGLAVVGFIALILIGIGTAIYAASFLPKAFSKLAGANVYLSTLDTSNSGTNTQPQNSNVVVTSTTTTDSVPLSAAPTPTTAPAAPTYTKPAAPVYTAPTYQTVVPTAPSYYGLPDLTVSIASVGYLSRSGDTSSYIATSNVPQGSQGAVRFMVTNRGTNVSGSWNFRAELPSTTNGTYYSAYQRSLNPGDSMIFTLGFDSTLRGNNTVRIVVDPNDTVNESNGTNNTDTSSIYLNGNGYTSGNGSYDSNGNYCAYGTYSQSGRTYCQSSNGNTYTGGGSYDSNGTYCPYGTYFTANQYYCQSSAIANGNSTNYDSNGSYCAYGTYYQNNRYYCNTTSSQAGGSYDTSGNYCSFGTYYQSGRYYCVQNVNNTSGSYDSNGNYCAYGIYSQNGRNYCQSSNGYSSSSYDSNGTYCRNGTYYSNNRYYCN